MLVAKNRFDSDANGGQKIQYDCFGLAILSHGDNDVVFGTDTTISINKLIEPIKECSSLVGKPKIFIIQVELIKFVVK
jgi:hypothetical protein